MEKFKLAVSLVSLSFILTSLWFFSQKYYEHFFIFGLTYNKF